MAVIVTGNIGLDLEPGVQKAFGLALKQFPTFYDKIFEVKDVKERFAKDFLWRGLGILSVKDEAGAVDYDTMSQGWAKTYEQVAYATGFQISKEAVDDGHAIDVAKQGAMELSRAAHETLEIITANHLNRAFNSSYLGGDGIELCATTHPTLGAGNQANKLAVAADLSEASVEQMIIDMSAVLSERGFKRAIKPKMLICHPSEAFNAHRILNSALQNDTMNNAINAIRSMGLIPAGVLATPFLTDSDAFFIKTDVDRGLQLLIKNRPEVMRSNDDDTLNAKFIVYTRFDSGWTDPMTVFGTPGA